MLAVWRDGGNGATLLNLELLDGHLSGPEIPGSTPPSGTRYLPPINMVGLEMRLGIRRLCCGGELPGGFPEGTEVLIKKVTDRSSCERAPFRAAGLERRFDVTFSSMRHSYADDSIFSDIGATAVALALVQRFEEAS